MSETTEDMQTWDEQDEEMEQEHEMEQEPIRRRPRRRLLTPTTALLFALLLGAGGFIIGVEVEKGEASTTSAPRGAGRLAGLVSAAGGAAGNSAATGATAGVRGFGGTASAGGTTVGQVEYVSGSDLYVTNPEGNTIKVRASSAHITRQVNSSVKGVHPGDAVIVQGAPGANGSIVASTVRDSGSSGGGLGASLFGAAAGGRPSGTRASGGGEPALFGK